MRTQDWIKRINSLVELVKDTDIADIFYEENGAGVGVKKLPAAALPHNENTSHAEDKESGKKTVNVFSNSVGLFRDYIPPSRKFHAKTGDRVNRGQKIGFIESMRIMKEVVSPAKGIVIGKFVKHGDPVEYGQKLFEIEVV